MFRSRAAKRFNEPAQLPLPLPLTDPRLSSAASCRDAMVLPRWGGENRRSGGRLPGAHRRPSPGRLRPFSGRSPGENAQARRPQACTQANNAETQGSKHWTARVIHLARKVSHARFKPSCATLRRSGRRFGRPTRHGCAGTGRHVSSVQGSGTTPGATVITSCQAGFFR